MRLLNIVGWVIGAAILVATLAAVAAIGAPILLIIAGLWVAIRGF